jgi:acetyl-CoA carboxylase biotin carboxylase subunit
MRACSDLGIETVAIFSDADRRAAHVLKADHAVNVGPAVASESYLNVERVLGACRDSGADAVHPGYGFLSENADFATACTAAGLTFIGPPPAAMLLMGSKTKAREAMENAGVPTVPGRASADGAWGPDEALVAAREVGFPVLIKASAGGGGKGMRLVDDEENFATDFAAAQREASSAFGDDSVYVEKAIVGPRHVEIQVFADDHGNVVHLGERDCSIQRRHQKVVEEAPCPVLSGELRGRMGEAAVAAARACDYRGAGTVEFLLDGDEFYFLEMNTRLQVEHPVTEMIFGVDLVEWQIRVAEGKALPLSQEEIDARRRGAAVECRIYAEDSQRFLPSPGTITRLRIPEGPFVRNDSGTYEGAEVSVHYDPLISKLVTWGDTRAQAVARMRRALDEYSVGGISTNLGLHRRIVREDDFLAGNYDTGYIEKHRDQVCEAPPPSADEANAVFATLVANRGDHRAAVLPDAPEHGGPSPWRTATAPWRRR